MVALDARRGVCFCCGPASPVAAATRQTGIGPYREIPDYPHAADGQYRPITNPEFPIGQGLKFGRNRTVRRNGPGRCTLYRNPLERALVLCVDEKGQIQALDRIQPILPWRLGFRDGTFMITSGRKDNAVAALNVIDGSIAGCLPPSTPGTPELFAPNRPE
jgi:hypothetical protein